MAWQISQTVGAEYSTLIAMLESFDNAKEIDVRVVIAIEFRYLPSSVILYCVPHSQYFGLFGFFIHVFQTGISLVWLRQVLETKFPQQMCWSYNKFRTSYVALIIFCILNDGYYHIFYCKFKAIYRFQRTCTDLCIHWPHTGYCFIMLNLYIIYTSLLWIIYYCE